MCQVSCGRCDLVDRCGELGVDFVEAAFEGSWGGAVAWEGCGETGAEKPIVGSGKEESGTQTGLGDAVALGVRQAFDHAVEAQASELVGHGAGPEGFGIAAAEVGQMVTQIGPAKALWQQPEEDQGMP